MLTLQSWSGGWQPIPIGLDSATAPSNRFWLWAVAGSALVALAFRLRKRR